MQCQLQERIRARIEAEKENDDHWAPGAKAYLNLEGEGIGHGEREDGTRVRGKPGPPPGWGSQGNHPDRVLSRRVEGIRYDNTRDQRRDVEFDTTSATLEAISGSAETMHENHYGGASGTENAGEDDGPNGFIKGEVKGTKAELDVLDDVIEDAYDGEPYADVGRRILAHVYSCQAEKRHQYKDGVPIDHRLIREACDGEVSRTGNVWWPLVDAGYMSYDDYEKGVTTRTFYVTRSLKARLRNAVEESYDTKTRYDLVSGKKRRGKTKTQLTYDGEHSWKQKSELIYEALKSLKGQRDLVNAEAVEEHLGRMEARKDEAETAYKDAKVPFYELLREHCEIEETEDGGEDWSLPEEGLPGEVREELDRRQEAAYQAGRECERASSRYDQDLRIWKKIKGQGLEAAGDMPEGIYQYETAYEVQLKSGRLTMLVGLQNASKEMKAAACRDIPGYNNGDIFSSQTEALIEEMELANELGASLDVSAVADAPDKEVVADHFGLDRDAPKTPEHGGKFGAQFHYDTFEKAKKAAQGRVFGRIKGDGGEEDWSKLHRFEFESGEMTFQRAIYNELPTMATVAQDWADHEDCRYDDPEKVYQKLKDFYQDMTSEIDRWREWLVDEHWEIAGTNGGDGYFVENPCGLPFDKTEYETRYDRKAAYATSRLQGREAAYMLTIAIEAQKHGYEHLRNEHDGAAVLGEIPDEARATSQERSGFHRASLENKPFKGHESDSNHTEDQSCNTKTSNPQSTPNPPEKPSRSPTSPKTGSSGDGSAGGTTAPDGARSERMPSGPVQRSREPSGTTSGTTCKDTAPSVS